MILGNPAGLLMITKDKQVLIVQLNRPYENTVNVKNNISLPISMQLLPTGYTSRFSKKTSICFSSYTNACFVEKLCIPRGKHQSSKEWNLCTAIREFIEETGFRVESFKVLNNFYVLEWTDKILPNRKFAYDIFIAFIDFKLIIFKSISLHHANNIVHKKGLTNLLYPFKKTENKKQKTKQISITDVKTNTSQICLTIKETNFEGFSEEVFHRPYSLKIDDFIMYMRTHQIKMYKSSNYATFLCYIEKITNLYVTLPLLSGQTKITRFSDNTLSLGLIRVKLKYLPSKY